MITISGLRRRTGNRMPIKTIIPDQQIRDRLSSDFYYPIVLYEETDLTLDSIGSYVAKCLQVEVGIKTVHFLQGKVNRLHFVNYIGHIDLADSVASSAV